MPYPIYRKPPSQKLLGQGDILDREPLRPMLKGHQPWFAESAYYYRYMVLTQTCDLDITRPIVDYIFLGVIRKLTDAFWFEHFENKSERKKTEQMLRDLYNHNYNRRGLFYLPKNEEHGIEEDSVVDLRVIFTVHKLHYQELLSARVGAITDVYAAQLGHITGHLFSRVATAGGDEIFQGKLAEHIEKVQGSILAEEKVKLSGLLRKADNACAVVGCERKAETYRWVPVKGRFEQHVFCLPCARRPIGETDAAQGKE
jgi:hypothetical protein